MTQPAPYTLADQADRERFATELEQSFSVIAPAGVGKTTAIVARVAALARADARAADPVLPRLAVVTYTRKAAEEMQARARARLLADGASPELLGRFSQAFFGTIHSLCLLVLKSYGHLVGLPSNLEQTTRLDPLWRQYLRSTDKLLHHLPEHAREPFLRHGSLSAALELVLKLPADLPPLPPLPPAPLPDISPILEAAPNKNKRAQQSIEAGQDFARRWLHSLHNDTAHLPLPRQTTGGKDFVAAYAEVFRPLCDWLGEATLMLAQGVAADFRNYRKAQGKLSFDDMVSWAAAVLDHPEAGRQLRRQRWCVILDEAQDTDPIQFHMLLGLAGGEPPAPAMPRAQRPSLEADALPPAGRFCMVGDPQQAIYGDRADLGTYRGVHQALVDSGRGQALRFTVTMRCDRDIVRVANQVFPNLLQDNGKDGDASPRATRQVPYVPLEPRPDAGPGAVSRLVLDPAQTDTEPDEAETEADEAGAKPASADAKPTDTDAKPANAANAKPASTESKSAAPTDADATEADAKPARTRKGDSDRLAARALARALAAHGPEAFGASDWSEVGILCVRNEPLGLLAHALEAEGLPVQNHSRQDNRGDSPAYAWFAGLCRIMAEPENAFETTGVLREVFGLSDSALYAYTAAAGYSSTPPAPRDKSRTPYHPLCLSAGSLALSGPGDTAEAKEVAAALKLLRNARSRSHALPLREAARQLSQLLDLPARLASLPDGRADAHAAELDNLLLQASGLQEQGYDWLQWADALEENFEARLDSAEPQAGHIQLLSCHKSKGLQWPVVILASLFRPVGYASDNFPKLLFPGRHQQPAVAFAAGHGHAAIEDQLRLKAFQELQRLAYVACTRARRQMIWADDSALYEKPEGSFADALGIVGKDASNSTTWRSLPLWQPSPTAEPITNITTNATPGSKAGNTAIIEGADADPPPLTGTGSAIAFSTAAAPRPDWNVSFAARTPNRDTPATDTAFIKRVLPSSLAIHEPRRTSDAPSPTATNVLTPRGHARNEPDGSRSLPAFAELEEAAAATAGADYGNWWHKAMEFAPWGGSATQWQHHAEAIHTTCPDPQRGTAEWQRFTSSALYGHLNSPSMIVRCELPLLWPDAPSNAAYDGFIDLVARDTHTNQWLLIDWKTDRLDTFADPAAELLRCYGPQLDAYRKALTNLFGTAVQAHLYNTPTGECSPPLAGRS